MRRVRSGEQGSRELWRAAIRGDSGQSLVLVTLAMALIVALAAFSIDVAQWNVGRHKAQMTADATALAAANCLASLDCKSTVISATNPGDAEQRGNAIAGDNGFPASEVTMGISGSVTSGGSVSVTIKESVASSFAGFFGMPSKTVSASAVASYKAGVSEPMSVYGADCSNPTNPPTSGCTVNCNAPGVTISTNGKTDISGAIATNGYVSITIGGNTTLGPIQSGPGVGTTCGKNTSTINSGAASIADGPADATGFTSFPTTYSGVWTNATTNECTASATYTARSYSGGNITVSGGTSNVPSTITIGGNNTSVGSSPGVVMCASTSITVSGNQATLTDITLVAPSILIQGNKFSITADPSALADGSVSPPVALYDTSSTELSFGTNDINVTGAVYAPLAKIYIGGNNGGSAELEGNTVEIDGNNGGDGASTTLTAFGGGDSLTQ